MTRIILAAALVLAQPLAAQELASDLWDTCVAAPDPSCAIAISVAEIEADPTYTNASGDKRDLVQLLIDTGQVGLAGDLLIRLEARENDARLWPLLLARQPLEAYLAPALAAAAADGSPDRRTEDIVEALADAGAPDLVQAVATARPDLFDPDELSYHMVRAHLRAGDLLAAEAVRALMNPGSDRDQADRAILRHRAENGDVDGVLAALPSLPPGLRADVTRDLFAYLPEPQAAAFMAERLTAFSVNAAQSDYPNAFEYGDLLALRGADDAVRIALGGLDLAENPAIRVSLLIPVLAATGDPAVEAAAMDAADMIPDRMGRAMARLDLLPHLRDPVHIAELTEWARTWVFPVDRAYMLTSIVEVTGDPALADEALPFLAAIADEFDRNDEFLRLVTGVANGPDPAHGVALIAAYQPGYVAADEAVQALALPLVRAGQTDLALQLVRDMTYEERMAPLLGDIAMATGDMAVMSEAMQVARDIGGVYYRVSVLTELARDMLAPPG